MRTSFWFVVAAFTLALACGDDSSGAPDAGGSAEGTEGARCLGSGTCNTGLSCVSDICVGDDGGSTGADGGAGGTDGSTGSVDDGADGGMTSEPCDEDNGGCDVLVTCTSDGAKVTCGACPDGYDDTHDDGTSCTDIDECATDNGGCGNADYWTCANNTGADPTCTEGAGLVVHSSTSPGPSMIIASGQAAPVDLAVDGDEVFWITAGHPGLADGAVRKAPRTSGPVTTLASGQAEPRGFIIDAVNAYWTTLGTTDAFGNYNHDGALTKVPLVGGSPEVLEMGLNRPKGIAQDSTYVYVTIEGEPGGMDSEIWRIAKDGGGSSSIVGPLGEIGPIVADATHLFWAQGGSLVGPTFAKVMRIDLALVGSPETILAYTGLLCCIGDLVLDANRIYADAGPAYANKDGTTPVMFGVKMEGAIAVDATHIYFGSTVMDLPGLVKMSMSSSVITNLTNVDRPGGYVGELVLDDTDVFFLMP